MPLVTIDFHNTLFHCDDWFRLEIERLPVAVIRAIAPHLPDVDPVLLEKRALDLYRNIRRTAIDTGVECDADTAMITVMGKLNVDVPASALRNAVAAIMREALATAHPHCGARELVGELASRGIPLAVVSSAAYHPFLEWCLAEHEMLPSFSHVVSSAACGIYKSDPAIYEHALALVGAAADSAIHIGDSHRYDVTSASRIGMRTILLTTEPTGELDPEPDAVISHLGEAMPHLDRLLGG